MKTLHRLHFALLLALVACCASDAFAAQKPNIILVMPDDVGYGDYASLGNPIMRTPSVDAFKKESLLFTQFHNARFTLVNNTELYDLQADPGETKNVIAEHPEVVAKLRAAYDQWWTDVQPLLVNENPTNIPKINLFQELYYKQFGGSPDEAALRKMDPTKGAAGEAEGSPNKKAERRKRKAGAPEDAAK